MRKKVLLLFLIVLFFGGVVFLLTADFLKIKKVSCEFNKKPCSAEIWSDLMGKASGKNLILFSAKQLERDVEIKKRIPDELLVNIFKKDALAIVKTKDEFFVIDDQGFVLEKGFKQGLPMILTEEFDQKEVAWTANLLQSLKLYLFLPQKTKIISSLNIEIFLEKGQLILFSAQKEAEKQLDSLQFIFSRAKIEGKQINKVDLRFDKPVVLYD